MRFAVSPCSNPDLSLAEALDAYARIGYGRFELFTSWCKSAADVAADPTAYSDLAGQHGFEFCSIHLPPIGPDVEAGIQRAAAACRFGAALGCRVALAKAEDRGLYAAAGKRLLDAINGLGIIPVLQNHAGTSISTLDDYREVLGGIDDARMKCTLEAGHFHTVGVRWPDAYDLLAGRIELVHVKDQVGKQSVPFGTGEIDLRGLIRRLAEDDYRGDVVIEMEVQDRENTLDYLEQALAYVKEALPA